MSRLSAYVRQTESVLSGEGIRNYSSREQGEDHVFIYNLTNGADSHGQQHVTIQIRRDGSRVVLYSRPDWKVPESRRTAVSEHIARVNFGMLMGNLEMDPRDGEVRFKTSAPTGDADDIELLMKTFIKLHHNVYRRYQGKIKDVVDGRASAGDRDTDVLQDLLAGLLSSA